MSRPQLAIPAQMPNIGIAATPGPALKMRQNRVLQPLRNTNNKIQENENGNTNPQRKSPRLLATPKHLNLSNKITATAVKISTKQEAEIEPTITTPKLETENQAVNKTLAKQRLEITAAMRSNATANSGGQLVTGDLASLCTIM